MSTEDPIQRTATAHSVAVAGTISPVLQRVGVFVLLTYVISAPFEYLAISAGSMGAAGGLYALGGMWSPGIAAIITTVIFRQPIRSFGWGWGKTRYQVWSILVPFLYCLVGYGFVWLFGLGGLMADRVIPRLQYLPMGFTIPALPHSARRSAGAVSSSPSWQSSTASPLWRLREVLSGPSGTTQ